MDENIAVTSGRSPIVQVPIDKEKVKEIESDKQKYEAAVSSIAQEEMRNSQKTPVAADVKQVRK